MYYFKDRDEAIEQFKREYQAHTRATNSDISAGYATTSAAIPLYNGAKGDSSVAKNNAIPPRSQQINPADKLWRFLCIILKIAMRR